MPITLRNIQEDDLEKIMNWRMKPEITKFMNTNPKLTIQGQKEWLKSIRENEKVLNWVVQNDGVPVGLICLMDIDWKKRCSSWGYYIGEMKARSLKLSISLEMSLYDFVFDILNFTELHNEVLSFNDGVVKLHQACGSRITEIVKDEVEKEGKTYDVVHMSITAEEWNSIRNKKNYEKIKFGEESGGILHHIGMAVSDIRKALEKYKQIGYVQTSEVIIDDTRKVNIVFIKHLSSGICLELVEPINIESPVSNMLKNSKNMTVPYHFCYQVDSLEMGIERYKKKGFTVLVNPMEAIALENRRVVFMFSKASGMIELVEK